MKILVVEDEPVTCRMLAGTLQSWGYEVLQAENGQAAWNMLQKEPIQIILTDWMMPGLDGTQLCRLVRDLPDRRYVYTIMLTSRSDKDSLLQGLAAGADDFITKPFETEELRCRIRAGQRIVDLQGKLHAHIDQLAELNQDIARSNQRMKEDLEAAAGIQRALLPDSLPEIAKTRFAWEYRPCAELGGDCLNVFQLDPEHVGLYVLDVSGHGVQAALHSVTLSRILSPEHDGTSLLVKQSPGRKESRIVPPAEVAEQLNAQFPLDERTGQYFTLLYGVLNWQTGEFRYATAGQPGPVYCPFDADAQTLDGYGFPIGFSDAPEYEERSVRLRPGVFRGGRAGDRLYLFTDGIVEAFSPDGEQFGEARLREVLSRARDVPLSDSLSWLQQAVTAWSDGKDPVDDVALLAVEMVSSEIRADRTPVALAGDSLISR